MDYSDSTAPPTGEIWAPRSPGGNGDRYAERPPVPAHDVDMPDARERRDDRGDFGRRDDRDFGRGGDRDFGRGAGGPPGFEPRRSGPPPRPRNAPPSQPTNVLGVFGLSIRTRERDLEDEFNRFGEVEKVVIVYDQRTDRSRGFGFITMRSVEDATACIDKLNGIDLHGRNIRVDYSATTKAHAPTPGEYRGEKRPIDDRFGGSRRFDDRPPRGGDRWGPRYDDRDRDRRDFGRRDYGDRGDRDGRDWRDRDRDRDRPTYPPARRDVDPYGGRSRREDDRAGPGPRGVDDERRRSPSPIRRRYSGSPDRRPPPPVDEERF